MLVTEFRRTSYNLFLGFFRMESGKKHCIQQVSSTLLTLRQYLGNSAIPANQQDSRYLPFYLPLSSRPTSPYGRNADNAYLRIFFADERPLHRAIPQDHQPRNARRQNIRFKFSDHAPTWSHHATPSSSHEITVGLTFQTSIAAFSLLYVTAVEATRNLPMRKATFRQQQHTNQGTNQFAGQLK